MKQDTRKLLLTVFGAVVDVALVAVWVVLVFAPEPVLSRVELRLAFPICSRLPWCILGLERPGSRNTIPQRR